jgi:hypothetical protein
VRTKAKLTNKNHDENAGEIVTKALQNFWTIILCPSRNFRKKS